MRLARDNYHIRNQGSGPPSSKVFEARMNILSIIKVKIVCSSSGRMGPLNHVDYSPSNGSRILSTCNFDIRFWSHTFPHTTQNIGV